LLQSKQLQSTKYQQAIAKSPESLGYLVRSYKVNSSNLIVNTFTGMLLLGDLHLVFGVEMTISALRKVPLSRRPRFAFAINLVITGLLMLITLIVAQTTGFHSSKCPGGVAFLIASLQMNRAILAILTLLSILFIIMAGIIALQLKRTIHIDPNHRISASRMVYYLVLGAVIQVHMPQNGCK
jgi:hypothetical protein